MSDRDRLNQRGNNDVILSVAEARDKMCPALRGAGEWTVTTYPDQCPHCSASLVGEPIPEHLRASYGATHFARAIGVVDPRKDRVVRWRCPDCGWEWPR